MAARTPTPETSGLAGIHLFMVVRTEQYFATWTTVTYLINVTANWPRGQSDVVWNVEQHCLYATSFVYRNSLMDVAIIALVHAPRLKRLTLHLTLDNYHLSPSSLFRFVAHRPLYRCSRRNCTMPPPNFLTMQF